MAERSTAIYRRAPIEIRGRCGAMKILILITVIESLAVMSAIMYFYYRRSQKIRRFADGTTLSFRRANGEGKTLKAKKVDQQTLGSIHSPLKEG